MYLGSDFTLIANRSKILLASLFRSLLTKRYIFLKHCAIASPNVGQKAEG
ncbi:MAG: hypothetical protein RIC07_30660 [Coleofasciculus sp. E1-EBD-02]